MRDQRLRVMIVRGGPEAELLQRTREKVVERGRVICCRQIGPGKRKRCDIRQPGNQCGDALQLLLVDEVMKAGKQMGKQQASNTGLDEDMD